MPATSTASLPRRLVHSLGRWGYRLAYAGIRLRRLLRAPYERGVRCVLTHGDELLLVRHSYGDRGWTLPGGRLKGGEQPADTARREMREELGVETGGWELLSTSRPNTRSGRGKIYHLHADIGTRTVAHSAVELTDVGWFSLRALPEGVSDEVVAAARAGLLPPCVMQDSDG